MVLRNPESTRVTGWFFRDLEIRAFSIPDLGEVERSCKERGIRFKKRKDLSVVATGWDGVALFELAQPANRSQSLEFERLVAEQNKYEKRGGGGTNT